MKRFRPAALWMAIISITSSTVISSRQFTKAVATSTPIRVTEEGFASFWQAWWWVFVKGYHALEFAILAVLIERALPRRYALAFGITALCASVDEWHQTFVPARGGRLTDVLIDCGGALVGLGFAAWLRRRQSLKGLVD